MHARLGRFTNKRDLSPNMRYMCLLNSIIYSTSFQI
uniref:Uncharacterized protein n=1 Tax=Arundo donax TaxID=35708 RepID=A0A0A8Z6W9_ARUDO